MTIGTFRNSKPPVGANPGGFFMPGNSREQLETLFNNL